MLLRHVLYDKLRPLLVKVFEHKDVLDIKMFGHV